MQVKRDGTNGGNANETRRDKTRRGKSDVWRVETTRGPEMPDLVPYKFNNYCGNSSGSGKRTWKESGPSQLTSVAEFVRFLGLS